jgi:hypothetical protein
VALVLSMLTLAQYPPLQALVMVSVALTLFAVIDSLSEAECSWREPTGVPLHALATDKKTAAPPRQLR